jgi:serine/threonine protein kinase
MIGRLPVEEALGIALQIAQALEEAHEKGIVHRDLEPHNVKVRAEGTMSARIGQPAVPPGLGDAGDTLMSP